MKKNNITFERCQIGLGSSNGYVVKYHGSLIAILEQDESSGNLHLSGGYEHPYVGATRSWDSISDAREELLFVGKLYDTGKAPREIERALKQLEKEEGPASLAKLFDLLFPGMLRESLKV